ncbi:chromatin-remodeling ATPase INO80 [Neocloeon triangulifer]|uniref:chromatin-remodeling ATPase INO80 n=1 Tax=Neocloeon triangulifer TaxID=2078957 RepID=UPI00286F47D2|nr:chromatin-remodeling ATPase INO80 [Neocloeon triangulifer]
MNSIVEGNLDLRMFLSYADGIIENGSQNRNELNSDDSSDDAGQEGPLPFDDLVGDEKTQMFNFGAVDEERQWLQDTLLSDSDDSSEEDEHLSQSSRDEKRISLLLKQHCVLKRFQRKYQVKNESNKWLYFGAGVLTKEDFYSRAGKTKFSSEFSTKNDTALDMEKMNNGVRKREGDAGVRPRVSNKKRKLQQQKLNIEALTARRRKVWVTLCKKEIGKVQRGRSNFHKEMLTNCKRAAQLCMRVVRNKATQSQRNMKDTVWRMKRLTREMQAYWKKTDKVEREARKRMEKEAEEQRKQDIELMEAKRQQRKLNFLITQTELYAHFMQRKLSHKQVVEASAMNEILRQLDETAKLPKFDDYNSEAMKEKAKLNVTEALRLDEARAEAFPMVAPVIKLEYPEGKQPDMFRGVLKHYQLKGVSWLANLYDQGINGILADEMGLGKTVQAIAFLCHIAEKYSIWGPFLVISPASTLHNWQQEFARFVPKFKVIPYWGNPQERRILRQFWANKDVHTEDASFHVVITSYQLVVSDIKYFNKVKWQYLVLDEAQAIKSTASIRWKSLLGFQCRNRLLLSGTPVQNSMAELWALLHFIMPMLFDSHDEFAEWFSKDIENVAENKGSIDEKHLSRLHMILKPFMLRRVKKDVENELSDKIEIMVYCPLTSRQKLLYRALKKKIRIEDLLCTSNSTSQSNITSNLMNLVMQFRKVCNHPDLFERQEPKMPLQQHPLPYDVPKLLYCMPSFQRLNCNTPDRISNLFNIFVPENIHLGSQGVPTHSTFSFAKFLGQSAQDVSDVFQIGPRKIWELELERINRPKHQNVLNVQLVLPKRNLGETFADLVFTKCSGLRVHSFGKVVLHTMRETLEHRAIRSSKIQVKCEPGKISSPTKKQQPARVLLPEFEYIYRQPQVLRCQPLEVPEFLNCTVRKIDTTARRLYCYHRRSVNLLTEAERAADALLKHGVPDDDKQVSWGSRPDPTGYVGAKPIGGWFNIQIPNKQSLISDAGKLTVLDELLQKLKANGHRVLVYSQMTKMIDLLEEFMYYRKHTYMRLDGSSKISERRDMVADFQNREDIFVFLLSTRAGGLGINLTAADTVIFYDSDWNPTVDQQAMDRAHRLGQTKQVTVYRLICKGTIEERILTRAREKSEIQRMVISGGGVKPDSLKPTEVVSLLLDDDEIEQKYKQKQAERRRAEEVKVQPLPFIIKQEPVDIEEGGPSEGSSTIDDSEGMLTIDLDACPKNLPAKARSNSILKAVKGLAPKPRVPTGRSRGRPRSAGVTRAMSSSAEGQEGSSSYQSALERRGRGRPRLKPYGPANMGSRKRKKATDNAFEGEVTIDQLNPSIGCPLPAENISTIDLELDVNSWSFLKH